MDGLGATMFPDSVLPAANEDDDVEVDEGDVGIRKVEAFVLDDATEQVDELDELEE